MRIVKFEDFVNESSFEVQNANRKELIVILKELADNKEISELYQEPHWDNTKNGVMIGFTTRKDSELVKKHLKKLGWKVDAWYNTVAYPNHPFKLEVDRK